MFDPDVHPHLDAWGYYDHPKRIVWLRGRFGELQARSVLAHELAHAEHAHDGSRDEWEREAEATAAHRLISAAKLRATAKGLNLGGALAIALGVLPRDVHRYVEENQEQATAAIMDAFFNSGGLTVPRANAYRQEHQPIAWDLMYPVPPAEIARPVPNKPSEIKAVLTFRQEQSAPHDSTQNKE